MHPMLNIAIRAVRAAGNLIMRQYERSDALTIDATSRSDGTSVSHQAESRIVDILKQSYPDHTFLGRESGMQSESGNHSKSGHRWIVEPLNGTDNYLYGLPQFSISLALEKEGKMAQAVIYDPITQELFTATRGRGAWLNNKRLRVSRRKHLAQSMLATRLPDAQSHGGKQALAILGETTLQAGGVRATGSPALDLAYVAAGRLDGCWHTDLEYWEMAAGSLILRESGGLISEHDGGENWLESGHLVAANPRIFHGLLQLMRPQ